MQTGFGTLTFFDDIPRGFRRYEKRAKRPIIIRPLISLAQTGFHPQPGVRKSDRRPSSNRTSHIKKRIHTANQIRKDKKHVQDKIPFIIPLYRRTYTATKKNEQSTNPPAIRNGHRTRPTNADPVHNSITSTEQIRYPIFDS